MKNESEIVFSTLQVKECLPQSFSRHISNIVKKATASPSFSKEWRAQIVVNMFGAEVVIPYRYLNKNKFEIAPPLKNFCGVGSTSTVSQV